MLDERNQLIERSKAMMNKVQTTYQTQAASYETQADAATTLIMNLKKEYEAMAEKVDMDIKRIRIIIRGRRERLHQRLEENDAFLWGRWSKQPAELQLLCADVRNR